LIAGIQPLPENATTINAVSPQSSLLGTRFQQLVTALNYAIQTTPPPQTPEARRLLIDDNLMSGQLLLSQGFLDLARDRMQAVIDLSETGDISPEMFASLGQQLTELNAQLNDAQSQIANMSIEAQASPIQKSAAARQLGAVGLAIQLLQEAVDAGMNPTLVKPNLLDLYCQIGQPDKALDLWTGGNVADPVLSDGPGTAAMRQGRVFLLLGNYSSAVMLWSTQAIPQLQGQRAMKAPAATRSLIEGDPISTARTLVELPEEVTKQAIWEFDLGMAAIESGQGTDLAGEHLAKALTLQPNLSVRPVIAYYLQKLGKPVPVDPKDAKPSDPKPVADTKPAATTSPK
jgi:tetratricopeptide (TPR) repeat protein